MPQTFKEDIARMKLKVEQLTSTGERLSHSSSIIRASDIRDKIKRLKMLYEHLESKASARLNKLENTLSTVHDLDRNMQLLRQWLISTEHRLTSPLVYEQCDFTEIERHVQAQKVIY